MKCVHCERPIRSTDDVFTYPLSKAAAHLACVSQASVSETDQFLLHQRAKPTRRVYTVNPGRCTSNIHIGAVTG